MQCLQFAVSASRANRFVTLDNILGRELRSILKQKAAKEIIEYCFELLVRPQANLAIAGNVLQTLSLLCKLGTVSCIADREIT
jgi:hypothetical protein